MNQELENEIKAKKYQSLRKEKALEQMLSQSNEERELSRIVRKVGIGLTLFVFVIITAFLGAIALGLYLIRLALGY